MTKKPAGVKEGALGTQEAEVFKMENAEAYMDWVTFYGYEHAQRMVMEHLDGWRERKTAWKARRKAYLDKALKGE